jgi:hypothetical protein
VWQVYVTDVRIVTIDFHEFRGYIYIAIVVSLGEFPDHSGAHDGVTNCSTATNQDVNGLF